MRRDGIAALLLFILPFVAMAPLLGARFTTWDDIREVADNPRFNPPTLANLAYYWAHAHQDLYIPVTRSAWMMLATTAWRGADAPPPQRDIPGVHLDARVFHAGSLAAHALATVALYALLRRLRFAPPAAVAAAAVFAIHPLQVEAVGWVSGLKDVLCGLLSLLALRLFLESRVDDAHPLHRRRVTYALATVLFVLALLAKPSAVVVPVIALVLAAYDQRQWRWRMVAPLVPWFVASLVCVAWTHRFQQARPGLAPPVYLRPLIAGDALAWYAYKLLVPLGLTVDYGRRPAEVIASGALYVTWLIPVALAALVWRVRRRLPGVAAGAAVFAAGLLPVLGFVPFDFQGYSTVADHYLYLPMAGIALGIASILARGRPKFWAPPVIVLLIALGVLTFRQSRTWLDSSALFGQAIDVNPKSVLGYDTLGRLRLWAADPAGAVPYLQRAVTLLPTNAGYRRDYAAALAAAGRPDLAAEQYRAALRLDPTSIEARRALEAIKEPPP